MSFDDFNMAREAQRAPGLSSMAPAMLVVPPNIGRAEAVRAFKAHADGTNDIFHIAAQVIARVILQASKAAVSVSTPGKLLCTMPWGFSAQQGGSGYVCEHWRHHI